MSLPLVIRVAAASETNLVLAAWKKHLYAERFRQRWGRSLDGDHFWALINHVVDRISFPSSLVLMGCYETEPSTPLCWLAVRAREKSPLFDVLYTDARHEILKDIKLSAALEMELRARVGDRHPLAPSSPPYDPYQELRR